MDSPSPCPSLDRDPTRANGTNSWRCSSGDNPGPSSWTQNRAWVAVASAPSVTAAPPYLAAFVS